jgi:hypothetical protein
MLRTGGELPQVAEKPAKKSAGHSKKRRRKGSESKGDSSPKHEQDREEFRGETAANVEPDTARANQATDGRGGSREDARVTSAEPRSDGPKNERPKGRKSRRRKGPPQLVTFVKGSKGHQRGPAS